MIQTQNLWLDPKEARHLATRLGTPLFVYSKAVLLDRFLLLRDAVEALGQHNRIFYALKANSNRELVTTLKEVGCSFEAGTTEELLYCLSLGVPPDRIHFSNPTSPETFRLASSVRGLRVSASRKWQLKSLLDSKVDTLGVRIAPERGISQYPRLVMDNAAPNYKTLGIASTDLSEFEGLEDRISFIHQHVGSRWTAEQLPLFLSSCSRLLEIFSYLRQSGASRLREINFGGGMDVIEDRADVKIFSSSLQRGISDVVGDQVNFASVALEPGRFLMGPCGILLLTVCGVEEVRPDFFEVLVDGGYYLISEGLRYGWENKIHLFDETRTRHLVHCKIVGDVCEPIDVLAPSVFIPHPRPGDIIGIINAGAYAFSELGLFHRRSIPLEVVL